MDFSIPCVHPGIFYWFSTWIICTSWSKLLLNLGANIFDKFEGYLWSLRTVPFNSVLLPKNMIEPRNIWLFTAYLIRCSNVFYRFTVFFFSGVWSDAFEANGGHLLEPHLWWTGGKGVIIWVENPYWMVESLQKHSVRHCWSSKVTPFGMDSKLYDNALRIYPSWN